MALHKTVVFLELAYLQQAAVLIVPSNYSERGKEGLISLYAQNNEDQYIKTIFIYVKVFGHYIKIYMSRNMERFWK